MKPTRVLDAHTTTTRLLTALAVLVLLTVELAGGQWVGAQVPGIISPRDNAVVAGSVAILGTATHPEFWKYELYFSPMARQEWVFVGQVHEKAVVNGQLEIWHTQTVPDGAYQLRLRVVRRDGNYDEYFVRNISVSNTTPTVTPTLEATPTRAFTPTPMPPTPTIVVEQPQLPTATPKPTADQPTVPETKVEPTAVNSPPSALSMEGLSNAACYGGALAGGVFLLVVILALLRRVVSLLLSRL
jgi:hypothetical protein